MFFLLTWRRLINALTEACEDEFEDLSSVQVLIWHMRGRMSKPHTSLPDELTTVNTLKIFMFVLIVNKIIFFSICPCQT